jgi:hypothetical protein
MTDLTVLDADDSSRNIHRIERSSVIEPGRYWRCTKKTKGIRVDWENHDFHFDAGSLYLLTRLEYFDGKLHSVVLLDDPSSSTVSGLLTLDLFLQSFEQVDDATATAFRNQQIAAVQGEAAEVQREMAEAQTNPALLQPVIEKGLKEWERDLARQRRDEESDDAPVKSQSNLPAVTTNGRFDLTAAVSHKISSTDVAVFRHMAQREGKIAEIRGKWLQSKVKELGEVLNKLTPFFAEHAAVGMARAQDALDLAKDVEKGLRSLRLYTGEGVVVNTLIKGESAPASEPLTVYQSKLFMDEEFAVWDDVDRMFDYTQSEVFFEALATNESLRQQLIPAQRGVVAMATRRTDVNYAADSISQALENEGRNKLNKALFLLVRDGGNWYQVWSDEPSHEISHRLFPTRNEMDQIFNGFDGDKIGFEDLRFTKRANEFDRKSLVYKRFLILACGLDHRQKLFGQFYPDSEALNFISMPFQAKYMRFIADDDGDTMLGDTVGSVHEYIRHNHSQLAAGCRVLVFGREILQQEAAPGAFGKGTYDRHSYKTHYEQLVRPRSKTNLLTVHRDKDDLVVYLPVERINSVTYTGFGSARHIKRLQFDVRVALNKLNDNDLGYLLTDIVKTEELRPFIYSRRTRASHLDYLYGFKLAMQVLREEEEANAPVIAEIQDRAAVRFGLSKDKAYIATMSAIQTWREKNPHTATLPAVESTEFAKLDFELAEAAYAYTHAIPKVEAQITALGGKVIRLTRGKKGMLVAYYEQPESERDLRIASWPWVGRRTFTAAGKPTKDALQTVWLRAGRLNGEYDFVCNHSALMHSDIDRLGLQKLQSLLDKTAEMAEVLSDAFKGERQGVSDRAWLVLSSLPASNNGWDEESAAAKNDEVMLPLAVDSAFRRILGIRVKVFDLLYLYGSDAQRAALLNQGYEVPKPEKNTDGKAVPYVGPELRLYMDGNAFPENYHGPIYTKHISPWDDYRIWDGSYKGERRLDHSLSLVQADKSKKPKHMRSPEKSLDGAEFWFPEQYRTATGEFQVSELFPGLATA